MGQDLTGIEFMLRSLETQLAEGSAPEALEAARIAKLVNRALDETRRIARGLSPVPLEPEGLSVGLRELAEDAERVFGIPCTFDCPAPVAISDPTVAGHLYDIAREALTNAVRHSEAEHISLALFESRGRATLTVVDDGVGLERRDHTAGMGLQIMEHRAQLAGAALAVRALSEGGTEVRCSVDLGRFQQ